MGTGWGEGKFEPKSRNSNTPGLRLSARGAALTIDRHLYSTGQKNIVPNEVLYLRNFAKTGKGWAGVCGIYISDFSGQNI